MRNLSLTVGLKLLISGVIVFVGSMKILDRDFSALSTLPPYDKNEITIDKPRTGKDSITVQDANMPIKIGLSPDDSIHITYFEREHETYEIDTSDGISIKSSVSYKWFDRIAVIDLSSPSLTILLPRDYTGSLDISTTNADITVGDLSPQDLKVVTTNGKITLDNLTVAQGVFADTVNSAITVRSVAAGGSFEAFNRNGSLSLKALTAQSVSAETSNSGVTLSAVASDSHITVVNQNGSITLEAAAAKTVTAKTRNGKLTCESVDAIDTIDLSNDNGSIKIDKLAATQQISLSTSNASISGVLAGKMSDYKITSKTSNAKNTLPERMPDGNIRLDVSNSNGSIDISFK